MGQKVTDSLSKCNLLNDYFSNVFTKDDGNAPRIECSQICVPPLVVPESNVFEAISALRAESAAGPDKIPSDFLMRIARSITPVLTVLFNRNISETFVPIVWKMAYVTPIFKKGSKTQPANYRPISLTCHFSKIMERIIKWHLFRYLQTYSKLEDGQHGYCPGLSTVTSLLDFYD